MGINRRVFLLFSMSAAAGTLLSGKIYQNNASIKPLVNHFIRVWGEFTDEPPPSDTVIEQYVRYWFDQVSSKKRRLYITGLDLLNMDGLTAKDERFNRVFFSHFVFNSNYFYRKDPKDDIVLALVETTPVMTFTCNNPFSR